MYTSVYFYAPPQIQLHQNSPDDDKIQETDGHKTQNQHNIPDEHSSN